MKNPYLEAKRATDEQAMRNMATEDVLPPAGFYDAYQASLGVFIDENLSISRYLNNDVKKERNDEVRRMLNSGAIDNNIAAAFVGPKGQVDYNGLAMYANKKMGTTLPNDDELDASIRETLKQRREYSESVLSRTTTGGTFGMIAGGFSGAALDPVNILSFMATPYRVMQGAGILSNVARAGAQEAAIGAAAETAIQPFVVDWKAEIDAPYTAMDAIENIGYAAGFGFVLGAAAGGVDVAVGRNHVRNVEQDYKLSDSNKVMGDILSDAEKNFDSVLADDAATSAYNDMVDLHEEGRFGAPDGDIKASEHYERVHKSMEAQLDDSPRFDHEYAEFLDQVDESKLDEQLAEFGGDMEIPARVTMDAEGQPVIEMTTVNRMAEQADEIDARLKTLRECLSG
jgi:hypothetical protein